MKTWLLSALLVLFAQISFADQHTDPLPPDNDWYMGIGIGITDIDGNSCNDYRHSSYKSRRSRCTETNDELSFRLFGGNRGIFDIGDYISFGAELGYANLGDFAGEEVDVIDLTAAIRIHAPMGIDVLARGGAAAWDAVNNDIDETYAVGIEKSWSSAFARVEWQRYDIENADLDVYMLSGGINF